MMYKTDERKEDKKIGEKYDFLCGFFRHFSGFDYDISCHALCDIALWLPVIYVLAKKKKSDESLLRSELTYYLYRYIIGTYM